MPEDQEVETEKIREAIHEEFAAEGGSFLKKIALTTALLAAFASVAALQAGSTVNEALVLKAEATRAQAEASDQWSYYQAKGVKAAVQESSRTSWLAVGKEPPAEYAEKSHRYEEEQKEIQAKAQEKEAERDKLSARADELLHRHHGFANAVALLQVSIALGAVSALTRHRAIWVGSLLVGLAGLAMLAAKLIA
jgi:hypothetical protein